MNNDHERDEIISNPEIYCPPEILKQQVALEVSYFAFDSTLHNGVIEVSKLVVEDVKAFFKQAIALNFPIEKVALASDTAYQWDDDKIMEANISSGFNYRLVAGTNTPSLHSRGLAFDINPRQNPYIRYAAGGQEIVAPVGALWQPNEPGTLSSHHPLVEFLIERGWEWGGNWPADSGRIDYQHFQKPLVDV